MSSWAFFRSSLVIAVASPLGLFLIAMFVLLLLPRNILPRGRRALLGLLTLLFAFSCTDFFGREFLALLESFSATQQKPDTAKKIVILVLGGGAIAEGNHYQPSVSSQRRLRRGLELLCTYSGAVLMLSGIEAPLMVRWLGAERPQGHLLLEQKSLNTRQNLQESAKVLGKAFENANSLQILLVTDQFHMARALRWASVYLPHMSVIPMPAHSLVGRERWSGVNFLPCSRGLQRSSMALREALALARDAVRVWLIRHKNNKTREEHAQNVAVLPVFFR